MIDWHSETILTKLREMAAQGIGYRAMAEACGGNNAAHVHKICQQYGISNGNTKRRAYEPLPPDSPVHPMFISPCCRAQCWCTTGRKTLPEGVQFTWYSVCGKCGNACDPVKRK